VKIAIVILVALVVLFAASVWIGFGREDGGSAAQTPSGGWLQSLERLTGPMQATVRESEIHAPCLRGVTFRIVASKSCEADLDESKANVRSVHLALAGFSSGHPGTQAGALLDPGRKVNVVVTAKDRSVVPLRIPLDARNPETNSIRVTRGGANLLLECHAAVGFCEVELLL
jgi:hypothetical protein